MLNANAPTEDSKPIVLIIDDSMDVHRLLKARLRNEEIEFVSTLNGTDGLQTALARQPSLVLLDLDMPGVDGFEVLRSLKENKDTVQIPVIVLSGMQSPQDKVTAFDLGAVDYVTKPFDLAELRVRLRSALRVNQLVKMLAQRAQIDGLTGLWNRAYFDRRWSEEYGRSKRNPRALSIAMLDIDHFKSINDNFGHPAGDVVLQGVAKLLVREVRAADIACRYGGEEFMLIMPDTSPTDAESLCERLRTNIQNLSWPRHPDRPVTVSFGVAGCSGAPSVSSEAWIELTDANLYAAKRSGRNKVVASDVNKSARATARLAG
jgi:diguanylate cyclase (GGDEF)-like protein